MTDELITDLVLAGYVPLRSQGIALPCYASGPLSNAWYCAVCSIDGDHAGTVSAFDPFDASDIVRLPEASQRAVSVGEPWHDVLLWNGEVYVGTPDIIIDQLGGTVAQLATDAPLTLLDLAMATNSLDRAALAKTAHAHLSAQWGTEDADRWQSDGFVRQQLLIEARRLLAHSSTLDKAGIIRELDIVRDGSTMRVVVPDRLRRLLSLEGVANTFERSVAAFASETGTEVAPLSIFAEVDGEIGDGVLAAGDLASRNDNNSSELAANGSVLIVTFGPRARQLARYLGTPDWMPDWNEGRKFPELPTSAIDVVEDLVSLDRADQYSIIIWVTDEEAAGHLARELPRELTHRVESGELLCIIAPVLPAQAPPALLADRSLPGDLPFTTILDTSIVRSPFWSGNPKRSIDRRVADLISATAQLVAEGTPLHSWLTTDRPRYEPLLLSISTGRRSDRGEESLASEVSSAGLSDSSSQIADEERFSWLEIPGGKGRTKMLQGEAVVRRHRPEFRPFAEALFAESRYPRRLDPEFRVFGDVPTSIADCLRYPHLTAAFKSADEREEKLCVISAEAPSLEALRSASSAGWSLKRYSDHEAFTQSGRTNRKHGRRSPLPSDISLPQLNRLGRNRGLAVRGVDPRDVIRIRRELHAEWLRRFSESPLTLTVRWYRATVNRYQEPPETSDYTAIPVAEFLRAEKDGDPAAKFLRDHDDVETPSAGALAKRTADLRASWACPAAGAWRLMFEDGRLPVRFGLVDDREVAAQKFFTVDGDGSVPLLFTSRLFSIWARATLTRSPSWSSRFSITRTFETFPIPDDFLVISDGEGGRASLRANPKSDRLAPLLEDFEPVPSGMFSRWERSREDSSEYHDERFEKEAMLLGLIGLGPDALDLDILERMVDMNRSAGM